jgi:selenide, water dikinase
METIGETEIRLTDLVGCGGCAAKYPAAALQQLVAMLPAVESEELLVGLAPSDDAAVFALNGEQALVCTVDFFPPIVDDPADFGSIAAANALSDVFAMGGVPLLALSIAAFPESLPAEVLGRVLAAASTTVREAGAVLAGGHTLRDEEPKFGLAVVGTVHPERIWTKAGAKPGDLLFLTKPLGTGLLVHARKEGLIDAGGLAEAIAWMKRLSSGLAAILRPHEPHAVTDVTGFGLLGHSYEVASRSNVGIELDAAALPALPGALRLAGDGVRTGGDARNRDYVHQHVFVDGAVGDAELALAYDPQTSGGLLIALPPDRAVRLERDAQTAGALLRRVGRVTEPDAGRAPVSLVRA